MELAIAWGQLSRAEIRVIITVWLNMTMMKTFSGRASLWLCSGRVAEISNFWTQAVRSCPIKKVGPEKGG